MIRLTFCVCLFLHMNSVKCETMHIHLPGFGLNCSTLQQLKVTEGDAVKLVVENNVNKTMSPITRKDHSTPVPVENCITGGSVNNEHEMIAVKILMTKENQKINIKLQQNFTTVLFQSIKKEDSGIWVFDFEYWKNGHMDGKQTQNGAGHHAVCSTKLIVVPPSPFRRDKFLIYVAVGGVVLCIIIIAEAVAIWHYRNKVKKMNTHSHLLGKSNSSSDVNDGVRYSTNPIQKAKKFEKNRDSQIYEVPDITIGGSSFNPPLPTLPRTDVGLPLIRGPPPPSPSLTLRSNVSSHPTFPRKPIDQDTLSMKHPGQRPPIPTPDEFYSVAQEEDNVYEPPPINEEPSRGPQAKKFGKQLPDIPMEGLKPRGSVPTAVKPNKPPIAQARPTPTPSRHNEGKPGLPRFADDKPALPRFPDDKPALPRYPEDKPVLSRFPVAENKSSPVRNIPENKPSPARVIPDQPIKPAPARKVFQVPIQTIPGPSTLKKTNNAKPKAPVPTPKPPSPIPTLEQQVKLFNDNRPINQPNPETWDDEDWTYEPLYNI